MKKLLIYTFLISGLIFNSCSEILDEEPRSLLTPVFFETGQGIEGGVTSAYASFRNYYCRQGGAYLTVWGTDEYTSGGQQRGNPLNTYSGITPDNGDLLTPWNNAYPAINTCNGVIELGQNATDLTQELRNNLIAEAKFLRAQWYFILVQTFGGATLDLGSGPLAFNRTPTDEFTFDPPSDVYAAIIQDLEEASNELPDRPRDPGRVSKASALHLLSKAYLTRGWSSAAQSDDYAKALATVQRLIPSATSPIANFGAFLMDDFADVHAENNHNNAEVLFAVQGVTENIDELQSGRGNQANFYWRCFYVQFPGMARDVENGRPWIRFRPTEYLLNEVYNNKSVDSRYDKSYQTVWYANSETAAGGIPVWSQADADAGHVDPSLVGELKFNIGDTAMWMLPNETKFSATEKASKGFNVLNTEDYTLDWYPALKKYDAKERIFAGTEEDPNINSYRPFIVYRLAGTYLVGAEAALMTGNTSLAADFINTLRRRAAWEGKENENLISAGEVDIDFILDERARELNGEMMRWFDLVRTGKLIERVQLYNEEANLNIQPFHILRPIPQSQIDLAPGYPQNQGY